MLGERSSGTNLAKKLLARNAPMQPTEALGWKHGYPSALAIPADLAVICMVRNAAAWALSMHAKPWHTVPALQALAFPAFIRAPWETVIDRARYFDGGEALVGQPLQGDRDPLTGRVAPNLFALRRAKLAGLLSYLDRGCTCALIRTETLQADPEGTIRRLLAGLGLPESPEPFRGVTKRLGARFKPSVERRPPTPREIGDEDRAFLRAELDLPLEAKLGYSY